MTKDTGIEWWVVLAVAAYGVVAALLLLVNSHLRT